MASWICVEKFHYQKKPQRFSSLFIFLGQNITFFSICPAFILFVFEWHYFMTWCCFLFWGENIFFSSRHTLCRQSTLVWQKHYCAKKKELWFWLCFFLQSKCCIGWNIEKWLWQLACDEKTINFYSAHTQSSQKQNHSPSFKLLPSICKLKKFQNSIFYFNNKN